LCPVDYETNQSHMGEAGETRPLTAAEGLELFAAQAAEQRRMWHEMRGLINAQPIMPCMQYGPGMPSPTLQRHFVSPSTPTFNQQMGHLPTTIQAPPFTLNGFQSAAIDRGPVIYPLQNSSLMNATSTGMGLPIPIEPSELFAAQAAEQRRIWHEMPGPINARPIMPCMQYGPGMPSATLQGHFVSPSTPTFNQQMGHLPATIQVPPFTLNGFQSAAIDRGPVMYPLQNSSLMNATSAGVGLPIPVEPSAVVPDISRRLGAKAWKQVVHDWEHPDASRKHFTALKDWKHEWHASSRQSQLWGQRRTIALEFIHEYVMLFQSQIYALTMYVGMGEMKTHLKKPTQNMRRG